MPNIFPPPGGGSGSGSGSGGTTSSGGGSTSSGGSSGSSGSSSSSSGGSGDGWGSLSGQQRMSILGQLSDIMFPLLGRKPTLAEAAAWYAAGMSRYATEMRIQMSKEYRHSADYRRKAGALNVQIQSLFGGRLNVKPKLLQSWIAHGYTAEDVQAWMFKHPHVFRQSNVYADRYQALADQYSQTLGVDWGLQDRTQPGRTHQVDTNKKKKGMQGNKFVTPQIPTAMAGHLDQAAFHFQNPAKYQQWLMRQIGRAHV